MYEPSFAGVKRAWLLAAKCTSCPVDDLLSPNWVRVIQLRKRSDMKKAIQLFLIIVSFMSAGLSQTKYDSLFTATSFATVDGAEISLSDYQGKVVVFDFWATWCSPCLKQFKKMQKLQRKYPDEFVVVAINPLLGDTKEDVIKFANDNEYDFIFVFDNGLAKILAVRTIPYKVYFDPDSKFITASRGYSIFPSESSKMKKILEKYRQK